MRLIPRDPVPGVLALLLLSAASAAAQPSDSGDVAIVGGRFTQLGDTVFISYRLIAPEDETVQISVVLRRGEDTTFAIVPVSATGAVGNVRGGGDKLILWNYKSDVPSGFRFGTDYWFQFEGVMVDQGFSPVWWHYALGGGVIAAVAVLVGSGDEDQPATIPYTLPDPPGSRPTDE